MACPCKLFSCLSSKDQGDLGRRQPWETVHVTQRQDQASHLHIRGPTCQTLHPRDNPPVGSIEDPCRSGGAACPHDKQSQSLSFSKFFCPESCLAAHLHRALPTLPSASPWVPRNNPTPSVPAPGQPRESLPDPSRYWKVVSSDNSWDHGAKTNS